jgi:hypothetical protein
VKEEKEKGEGERGKEEGRRGGGREKKGKGNFIMIFSPFFLQKSLTVR